MRVCETRQADLKIPLKIIKAYAQHVQAIVATELKRSLYPLSVSGLC